ncbi:Chromatin accessibility complex protein 1 [Orchesella cincta]|uniref:Chromatin accessibility complex protein 1 n=1 Tax=Orchesella cincta TaxID=48709 RepID=A0A1D2NI04_ORCCI|nr:Chromatin accessibility complex protein 1 [Orchesella cincta]
MAAEKSGSSKKNSVGSSLPSNSDDKTGGQSTRLRTDVVLPQTKVKVIMKSSPEIEVIGGDSVFLITKATELFIDHLTTTAYSSTGKSKTLQYKNLAEVVHKHQNMEFLRDIIPVKIPARVALQEMAKQTHIDNKELME